MTTPRTVTPKLLTVAAVLLCIVCVASIMASQQEHSEGIVSGKYFDYIFIIIFENQPYSSTIKYPYFEKLAKKVGGSLEKSYAITHPSQPNYLTLIAGDNYIHSDSYFSSNDKTLVDLMEAKGVTWRAYMEDYPTDKGCFDGETHDYYARKHNPFMIFTTIRNNTERCKNIVNSNQLYNDLQAQTLPQYMFYTPNLLNDAHNTNLTYANQFLEKFLDPLLSDKRFMRDRSLVLITFDEDNYLHFNHIYTALVGDIIKPGSSDSTSYNHYDVLRTIEDNWDLGTLGKHDESAKVIKLISQGAKKTPKMQIRK